MDGWIRYTVLTAGYENPFIFIRRVTGSLSGSEKGTNKHQQSSSSSQHQTTPEELNNNNEIAKQVPPRYPKKTQNKKSKMDKLLNKVPNQAPDGPLGTDKKGPSPIPPHTNPPII